MADTQKTNTDSKPKRKPFHEEFAEKIIARLKEGTAPWQQPWHSGSANFAPHNPVSGTVYRGVNRVSLSLSGHDDPRWMTLKQANDKGMTILPGSKSTPVIYYQFSEEKDRVGEDGKPVLGENGKPLKEKTELDRPIMRFARVFNAEQIDGMPPMQLTDKAFDWNPVEKGESILAASGADIKHDQSSQAFYRPRTDSIHLPPRENFEDPGKYYGTALHELGHWTKHPSRLNREGGPFGSEQYAREELRAEIASWMLGQDTGIPHDPEQHAAYVQSWIKVLEQDPYEIQRACRDAELIKEYVLDLERKKEMGLDAPEAVTLPEQEEAIAARVLPKRPATEKTYLSVPYKEKEQAKALGAKWDKAAKSWYAPEGTDLSQLSAWLPDNTKTPESLRTVSPQEEFALALEKAGLDLEGKAPVMDGAIHRVPLIGGKPGERDGAYCGFLDERPAGWMQNFSSGEKLNWTASGHTLSKEALVAQREEIVQRREEQRRVIAERQHAAAKEAQTEWAACDWALQDNAYLQKKTIPPFGVREDQHGNLMVPVRNVESELRGLQFISPEGQKRFLTGMEKQGNFHLITGSPEKDLSQGEILLAEGYATGASLHMATGKPVAVAFDAGNLEPVARKLREKYPNAAITICADNDHQHTRRTPEGPELWNKGLVMAQDAAKAVGGKVLAPVFNEEEKARGLTDFNDLHVSRGLEEVKRQVDGPALDKTHEKERKTGKSRKKVQDKGRGLGL